MSSRPLPSTVLCPHSWGSGGPTPLPPAAHSGFGGGRLTFPPAAHPAGVGPDTTRLRGPASSSRAQCRRKLRPWGTVTPRGVVLPGLTYVFLLRMKHGGTPRMSQSVSGCCASGAGGVRPGVRGGYGSYNPPTPVKEREGGAQTAQQTRKDPRGTVHRSRSSGGIQYLPEACREGQPRGIFCHCPTRKHVASVLLTASRLRVSCDFRETGTRLH